MLSLSFTPLLPWPILIVLGVIVAVLAVFAILARGRTALLRVLVLALVLAALTGPALVRKDREPVKDVAAIVVDRSGSQQLGDRPQMTDAVRAELQRRFGALANIEPRFIDVPDATPLMFDAESGHIRDAKARHGALVLLSRATLKSLRIVPLPQDLRDDLDVSPAPMADAVVIEAVGPERQVIRVPGRPDEPVSTLDTGDSYRLLVGGVLVTREGLPETFAELGQWECLDPDTHGACQLPPTPG